MAELYASLFLNDLDNDHQTVKWLDRFSELAAPQNRPVADLGCGPGGVVNHLAGHGLDAYGLDLSQGQIDQARKAFPDLRFEVGDLTALDVDTGSLGGIVAKYSIIHLAPDALAGVFAEWHRALNDGAPLFVSFFGSRSADSHGLAFDHKVATAYELDPATIGRLLGTAGFVEIQIEATAIPEGGRPFDHTTILARTGLLDSAHREPLRLG